MIPRLTSPDTVLSGRFRFRNPALLCARLRLYADRLELSGWHMRGRYVRRILLQQVLQADALDADSLLLWLSNGETVRLRVRGALRWKRTIEQQQRRLRNRVTGFNSSQTKEVSS
ncbi:MAG TPA: hypothetical protein VKP65_13190 [Rhodothermales bacterium]|nr:hypothetical protein [Rhodothermales bacterium]